MVIRCKYMYVLMMINATSLKEREIALSSNFKEVEPDPDCSPSTVDRASTVVVARRIKCLSADSDSIVSASRRQ